MIELSCAHQHLIYGGTNISRMFNLGVNTMLNQSVQEASNEQIKNC